MNFLFEHKWAVFAFIGALIVAVGALKTSIDQKESEKKADRLSKELQAKTEEITKLQEQTIQLQNQNNVELTHQRDLITGGDSYPILLVTREKPYLYEATLWISGEYPLFNFSMSVLHRNGKRKGEKVDFKMDEVRQVSPTTFTPKLIYDLREEPNLKLLIRFHARNGSWNQEINFRKNKEGVYQREIKLTSQYGQKEPIVYTSFESDSISFGNVDDLKSLEYHKK